MKHNALSLLCLAAPLSLSLHADEAALDTQTVTADFRNTDVQQIPEAVTVVGQAQMEARSAEHLEQVLSFALDIADRVLVIENGEIVRDDPRDQVDAAQVSKYLSV